MDKAEAIELLKAFERLKAENKNQQPVYHHYPPPSPVCPCCGRCRHCGQGPMYPAPYTPYWSIYPTSGNHQPTVWPTISYTTTTGGVQ